MIYEKKIGCDKTELLEQLRGGWPILNTLWLKHRHLTDKHKKLSQLEIWKELLKGQALEHPTFCQFGQLMIATSPNTSDLERVYSRIEMITAKSRNQLKIDNLETLFVLPNLQIPVKSPLQYENEVAYLEENN